MNNIKINSRGYYNLSVLDAEGNANKEKEIKHTGNVITYAGAFETLFYDNDNTSIFSAMYAAVGTGTVELTRTSSSLGAESGGRSGGAGGGSRPSTEVDNLDGTSTITTTRTVSFGLGSKVGTFSEIGLWDAGSGGTLVAGQLIKDEFGDPTTVTLLSDEQLVVTYTLEWTIPNTSTNIGSGTVTDSLSNSYNYEVWIQPYFTEYAVGANSNKIRHFKYSSDLYVNDEVVFLASDGTTSVYDSGDVGSGFVPSHDGAGTVTFTTQNLTFAPSSFSTTDLKFIGFYGDSSSWSGEGLATTTPVLGKEGGEAGIFISFDPVISKTSSDSFNIQAEYTLII